MISKLNELFIKYRQFLLFCIVGVANTLITTGMLFLLFDVLHVAHGLAYALAYAAGVVNGYFWSTRAVFKTKGTAANLTKFIVINLLTMGVNQVLMWLLVDKLGPGLAFAAEHHGLYLLFAQAVVLPFTSICNFFLNKYWTFAAGEK